MKFITIVKPPPRPIVTELDKIEAVRNYRQNGKKLKIFSTVKTAVALLYCLFIVISLCYLFLTPPASHKFGLLIIVMASPMLMMIYSAIIAMVYTLFFARHISPKITIGEFKRAMKNGEFAKWEKMLDNKIASEAAERTAPSET